MSTIRVPKSYKYSNRRKKYNGHPTTPKTNEGRTLRSYRRDKEVAEKSSDYATGNGWRECWFSTESKARRMFQACRKAGFVTRTNYPVRNPYSGTYTFEYRERQ